MLSNSDTISQVLAYIKNHPDKAVINAGYYTNAIDAFIADTTKISNADRFFPDHKVVVNRMAPEFIDANGDLLDYFYDKTKQADQNYHDLWITTGHIAESNKYLIELSFE
ncbi:hypothetical protein [Lentilactobacillus kribbianus]|uniref:hypothetical protein n=1 Tax=Lentilactobacillus kribbianus TaxID=2729622 RepID=UPI00155599CE|nr:hypothetical protein [Lentilactobacillus kribbianus]